MYSYRVFKISEMDPHVGELKTHDEKFGLPKYEGFRYFSPDHVFTWSRRDKPVEDLFFLAFERDKIVGVLLLQKSPYEEECWWISYIDVHVDHKLKGVAKGLYESLNNWVDPEIVIYGSCLSLEGKEADLHNFRKRIITRCKTFADATEYYEFITAKQVS